MGIDAELKVRNVQGLAYLEWKPWFAWYPVKQYSTGKWTWLKKVYRRKCYYNYKVVVPSASPMYIEQKLSQFIFETSETVLCEKLAGTKMSKLESILKLPSLKRTEHKQFFID